MSMSFLHAIYCKTCCLYYSLQEKTSFAYSEGLEESLATFIAIDSKPIVLALRALTFNFYAFNLVYFQFLADSYFDVCLPS